MHIHGRDRSLSSACVQQIGSYLVNKIPRRTIIVSQCFRPFMWEVTGAECCRALLRPAWPSAEDRSGWPHLDTSLPPSRSPLALIRQVCSPYGKRRRLYAAVKFVSEIDADRRNRSLKAIKLSLGIVAPVGRGAGTESHGSVRCWTRGRHQDDVLYTVKGGLIDSMDWRWSSSVSPTNKVVNSNTSSTNRWRLPACQLFNSTICFQSFTAEILIWKLISK